MKVCFPVKTDTGLQSLVFGHFGSAPEFIIFDEELDRLETHKNINKDHEHGQCEPLKSFGDNTPDIVIVKGIGGGALRKLLEAGVKVFRAESDTIQGNLDLLTTKGLPGFSIQEACSGHDHHHHHQGKSCGHKHGESCSH